MDLPFAKSAGKARISSTVRALRLERGWTQAALATKLGLSQSRLSEIEHGDGSFTAEQFLVILRLFNVTTNRFTGRSDDRGLQVQNALARLGAAHLRESSDVAPADDLVDPVTVAREALVGGDPRLTAALAPVLIENADQIGLGRLYLDLEKLGLGRRLAWLCENSSAAVDSELLKEAPRSWTQRARRSLVVLNAFLENLSHSPEAERIQSLPPDVLDPTIRSTKTLDEVKEASSGISKKWGIVSALQPRDFAQAIRAASATHS